MGVSHRNSESGKQQKTPSTPRPGRAYRIQTYAEISCCQDTEFCLKAFGMKMLTAAEHDHRGAWPTRWSGVSPAIPERHHDDPIIFYAQTPCPRS
jgi:hypothetical protein